MEPGKIFYRTPWVVSGLSLIIVVVLIARCFWWPIDVTTVYIVRHAEKANGGTDPELSLIGHARAQKLKHVLKDDGIDAVFVSNYLRTQQTGAPVANAAGVEAQVYQASATDELVNLLLSEYFGKRILVVGHSNTVDDIAVALGIAEVEELSENQYDRLFVINRFAGYAHLGRQRYGEETP